MTTWIDDEEEEEDDDKIDMTYCAILLEVLFKNGGSMEETALYEETTRIYKERTGVDLDNDADR